jgi:hypothetical protein
LPENSEKNPDYRGKTRPLLMTLCQEFWFLAGLFWALLIEVCIIIRILHARKA